MDEHEMSLCGECRDLLSKRPFPRWIKIVSGILLLIMIFSLIQFPSAIKAGIEYEKGIEAENSKKYITAMNHFKNASVKYPDSTSVQARLFIAYCYNGRITEASRTFNIIKGKKSSDDDMLKQVDTAMELANAHYGYSDDLYNMLNQSMGGKTEEIYNKLKDYTQKNPRDALGFLQLGNTLFDLENYKDAGDMYAKALSINPKLYLAHLSMASVYRQTGELDKAVEECNKVLQYNAEDVNAYASLSKIELKRHQYDKALNLALSAYGLDKGNLNVIDNLAIVYHYKNMVKERDEIFNILKQNNYYDIDRTKAIFDGKLKIYD
jgi:Flp pilus assembly protein TadD, contains TPR repeats